MDTVKLTDQHSAELPGFDARTIADDAMGKLMFIRCRIAVDVPDGLMGLLHDIEELAERVVGLVEELPTVEPYNSGSDWRIIPSGSGTLGGCSCGAILIDD